MSEGLKSLKRIGEFKNPRYFIFKTDNGEDKEWHFETIKELFPNDFDTIETALKKLEHYEKVLGFIKTGLFVRDRDFYTFYVGNGNYKYFFGGREVSKEDYDLLKEALL